MGSATSLSVQYDSQFVRAGETLSGKVLLRVLAADKVHANEVQVRFHGRETRRSRSSTAAARPIVRFGTRQITTLLTLPSPWPVSMRS